MLHIHSACHTQYWITLLPMAAAAATANYMVLGNTPSKVDVDFVLCNLHCIVRRALLTRHFILLILFIVATAAGVVLQRDPVGVTQQLCVWKTENHSQLHVQVQSILYANKRDVAAVQNRQLVFSYSTVTGKGRYFLALFYVHLTCLPSWLPQLPQLPVPYMFPLPS